MRTKIIFLTVLVMGLFLQGCITSLHPLYNRADLIFDKRMLGTWKSSGEAETWKLENLMEKQMEPYKDKEERAKQEIIKNSFTDKHTYLLSYTENGETRMFDINLLNLDNNLFIDLYPHSLELKNGFFEEHFLPVHTYAKVKISNESLELFFFDAELLYKLIDKDQVRIKHESLGFSNLLTASTDELQKFVKKYADRDDLFMKSIVLKKMN